MRISDWSSDVCSSDLIADDPRGDDIALILDRARVAAIADAEVTAALVGAEGNEQHHRALVDEVAREVGPFAVIADPHPDRPAVGVDRVGAIAAIDVPPAPDRNSAHSGQTGSGRAQLGGDVSINK